jgi:hypothetical protein
VLHGEEEDHVREAHVEQETHMEVEAQVEVEAHVEQEAQMEDDVEEEEGAGQGDQQHVNYRLIRFYFYLYSFLYEVTNSIFSGCDALSWLHLLGAGRTGW